MATTEENLDYIKEEENAIDVKEVLFKCLRNWYWILLSVIICMGLGFLYLKTTLPVYTRSAQVIIKTDAKSGVSELESFSDISTFQSTSKIGNEISTLLSPDLMMGVVEQLDLRMNYTLPGRWHEQVLYGENQPITARMFNIGEKRNGEFKLILGADSTVTLKDFKTVVEGEEKTWDKTIKGRLGKVMRTPLGEISVQPTKYYSKDLLKDINEEMTVSCMSLYNATHKYSAELSVTPEEEKSSVVNIVVKDVSIQRAVDIINYLILEYNKKWVDDKNQIAVSTSKFIDERLAVIMEELGDVDTDISSFKSSNLIPDLQAASGMYMEQANKANNEILMLNSQLAMANYVKQYLTNPNAKYQLLPQGTGFENPAIETQISKYNQLVMDRNSLAANTNESNPIVVDMNRDIADMKASIVSSIDNTIETIRGRIRTQETSESEAISHISSNPQQAKYLLNVERQQKVKEALYLYLLQKREENQLSQAFTAYNTRVIMNPTGSPLPTSPNNKMIYLIAFVLGLAIPIGIIMLNMMFNTTVRGRKDIETLSAPFVGEIPMSEKKNLLKWLHRKDKDMGPRPVVREGSRNVVNEAFRVVRANLEFMGGNSKVIAVTSANAGSGKTYIVYNLAASFAIKGKKVLVIDLDLRRGSLTKYFETKSQGFTDYIVERVTDVNKVIYSGPMKNLYYMPMGTMPPNPTELLYSDRFKEMINDLRDQFDYIFIDCPPIEIVADAAIINKEVDMTLFVIRAGLFERSMVPELDKIYQSERYKNVAVLLNGTESSGKYGNRYGYGYGYGNGRYGGYAKED